MNKELYQWRKKSTKQEWEILALLANTTTGYLNHIAYGYRYPSKNMAENLEKASKKITNLPALSKVNLIFGK